jgi:histidine phosphotransferase ChpT
MTDELDLAGLLCSRLCHDLISPVGAIGNGVELLMAEPGGGREELTLIDDSARAARAALAFFRIAFGAAPASGQPATPAELAAVAAAHLGGRRLRVSMAPRGDPLPRPAARLLLLMTLAGASAAPLGGELAVEPPEADPLRLAVSVEGRRAGLPEAAAALVTGESADLAGGPRDVHFVLLARAAAASGATVFLTRSADRFAIEARAGA